MICDVCKKTMVKIARYIDMDELDGTETEGQFADYLAAQESGDTGEWDYGVAEYECQTKDCPKRGLRIGIVTDSVKDYDGLILMWHDKAKQNDYFSRFIFEYISFNAYMKSRIVLERVTDRNAIQRLKRHSELKTSYLKLVQENKKLKSIWETLIAELKREPLLNASRDFDDPEMDKWWNCSRETMTESGTKKGIIKNTTDWTNMVEFWYAVRNNIFHGGKDPSVQRDYFLVEHAFQTLNAFMESQLKNIGDDLKIF